MNSGQTTGLSSEPHGIDLFTNLAGESSELAARLREVAARVLRRIGSVESRPAHGGVVATFTDAKRALICAVQIQRSFEDWGSSHTAPVRAGISRDDEDAAAVAAQAGGGEILVTESVRALTAPRGHLFTARGDLHLAGASVPLFALRWWEHD